LVCQLTAAYPSGVNQVLVLADDICKVRDCAMYAIVHCGYSTVSRVSLLCSNAQVTNNDVWQQLKSPNCKVLICQYLSTLAYKYLQMLLKYKY